MAIKGKTFDLQTITAKDDGALYRILSGESDMIVFSGSGTALSINSNILTIAECYLLVGGRYIHIEDGSTIDLGTIPNSSNRGRVIIKIDTSLGATQVSLDQVVPEIETIASGGSYRALVQNDINSDNGGSVYEIEFATFTCLSGVASSPALTTSVPTQTKIQALQDDIDTLADNLENAFPVPIANGGTSGTTKIGAQQNLGISYEATELTSGTITAYADALSNKEHRVIMGISGQSVTDLPDNATCTIEIYKFDANSILVRATKLDGTEFIKTKRNGTWGSWVKDAHSVVPIADGGTGASTLNSAQTNLGIFTGLGTIIPSGADLNNYTTIGIYSVNSWNNAQNISNIPEKNAGKLVVFNTIGTDTTAMGQLYITHGHNHVYYRNRASSTWNSEWGLVGAGDIMKVTYQNEALTGLQAKQMAVDSLTKLRGSNFGVVTHGNRYITLEPGLYRIHTNFRANPGANGFIKTCLKIGNTSTLFVITDQFYAGAGCGTNASIIGVNATEVIKITANTNIYFLVMSQNNTDGCEGSLTIERLG